jgi:hypothetical protein
MLTQAYLPLEYLQVVPAGQDAVAKYEFWHV